MKNRIIPRKTIFQNTIRYLASPVFLALIITFNFIATSSMAADKQHWVTTWAGSVQGPYPSGNPSAQPSLEFAFPNPKAGAKDQTFRLIIKPSIWEKKARIRMSNAFGDRPVTFDGVFIGMQESSASLITGSNQTITFAGQKYVTVMPGKSVWSDPVSLQLVTNPESPLLKGQKLAVSFHVKGESGPMTWHAKALVTSYVSEPGVGSVGASESEDSFPFSTTSWYFLDAVDMLAPADTKAIVVMGDSISDGTSSTINGYDRWPDALARKLQAVLKNRISIVNAGIGGNRVAGPEVYDLKKPFAGGPSMSERLERDVLSLSGVSKVIWLEGINDFNKTNGTPALLVQNAMRDVTARIKKSIPGVKVIGATLPSAFGSSHPNHGFQEQDNKRKELNNFIKTSGIFDAIVDFDKATLDTKTGSMRAEYIPDTSVGGKGDGVHPNRAGYLKMAQSIDINIILNKK